MTACFGYAWERVFARELSSDEVRAEGAEEAEIEWDREKVGAIMDGCNDILS